MHVSHVMIWYDMMFFFHKECLFEWFVVSVLICNNMGKFTFTNFACYKCILCLSPQWQVHHRNDRCNIAMTGATWDYLNMLWKHFAIFLKYSNTIPSLPLGCSRLYALPDKTYLQMNYTIWYKLASYMNKFPAG